VGVDASSSAQARALDQYLDGLPVDVVQLEADRSLAPVLRARGCQVAERLAGLPPELGHCGWWRRQVRRWAVRAIAQHIAPSSWSAGAWFGWGCGSHRLVVIRPGAVTHDGDRLSQRRCRGWPDDRAVVGLVGRLADPGDAAFLRGVVRAGRELCPSLQWSWVDVGVPLLATPVPGAPGNGPVGGPGFLSAPPGDPGWVSAVDVLVVLPLPEAGVMPLATVDALAAGTPVVVPETPEAQELLADGETGGLLVPPDRPELATQAVKWILDNPPLRHALSASGRRRATDFSVPATVLQYQDVYSELAAEGCSRSPR
jgi:hypothetical protein